VRRRVVLPDLHAVRRGPDGIVAVLRNAYTGETVERVADQVVAECGTEANADVYEELKGHSRNFGETDLEALASGHPQRLTDQRPDGFLMYRVGDAVAGRNIHAGMLDARRLALTL
jgi:hypothetical protein